jgi:hypothetical protein
VKVYDWPVIARDVVAVYQTVTLGGGKVGVVA